MKENLYSLERKITALEFEIKALSARFDILEHKKNLSGRQILSKTDRQTIKELFNNGWTTLEIAARLKITVTEVELLLQLPDDEIGESN